MTLICPQLRVATGVTHEVKLPVVDGGEGATLDLARGWPETSTIGGWHQG